MTSLSKTWQLFILSSITAIVLFAHASYYYPFLSDDALISLRYAARLLDGEFLTWNNGEYVEGYSNLLWILMNAALALFGIDLIVSVRLLGFISVLMIPVLFFYDRIFKQGKTIDDLWLGAIYYSFAAPISVWAIGGLEQPVLMLLFAFSLYLIPRFFADSSNPKNILLLALAFSLMILTRPDTPLFIVAFVLTFILHGSPSQKSQKIIPLIKILSFPIATFIGQLAFRMFFYKDFLPNTAYVKITPSGNHLLNGLEYVFGALFFMLPFSIFAFKQLFSSSKLKSNPSYLYILIFLVLYFPYLIFIGGDVFPAYRHMGVVIVAFFWLILDSNHQIMSFLSRFDRFSGKAIKPILISCFVLLFIGLQFVNTPSRRAKHERWEWIGKELGINLKQTFTVAQPLVAVTAAGCIPYWSELPALDMLGLNDKHIAKNRPIDVGDGMLGHELGDADYVLSRKPDLIIFNIGTYPTFRTGRELEQIEKFHAEYKPISIYLQESDFHSKVYIRLNSSKVGIIRNDDEITIPGYLFADTLQTYAEMFDSTLQLKMEHNQKAYLTIPDLDDDYWFEIDSKADEVFVRIIPDSISSKIEILNLSLQANYIKSVTLRKLKSDY
jgi:arabinofuranosyltransferase